MGGQGDDGDFIGDCWLMDGDEILFDDTESAEVLCWLVLLLELVLFTVLLLTSLDVPELL